MSDVRSNDDKVSAPKDPSTRVFRRLVLLLRPYWPMIGLGLVLLLLSVPCELFPAIVWSSVPDDIVLGTNTTLRLGWWFSFGGLIHGRGARRCAAVAWLRVIDRLGDTLGTLCTWLL